MIIKDWFEKYITVSLEELKTIKADIEEGKSELIEESQIVALNLAIVTKERNPDYSHMFSDSEHKKREKKEKKGQYVAGRGIK